MTDPDAPSRKTPKYREWCHWVVGNIPGTAVDKGIVVAPYIGPGRGLLEILLSVI